MRTTVVAVRFPLATVAALASPLRAAARGHVARRRARRALAMVRTAQTAVPVVVPSRVPVTAGNTVEIQSLVNGFVPHFYLHD